VQVVTEVFLLGKLEKNFEGGLKILKGFNIPGSNRISFDPEGVELCNFFEAKLCDPFGVGNVKPGNL
jgi:hypothetical protein